MKAAVTGGRKYSDRDFLFEVLDGLNIEFLILGGATGADTLAEQWAIERGVPHKVIYADWDKHGHRAGPIRNQEMVDEKPDAVVAFPGGPGTRDMVRRTRKARIPVIEALSVKPNGNTLH